MPLSMSGKGDGIQIRSIKGYIEKMLTEFRVFLISVNIFCFGEDIGYICVIRQGYARSFLAERQVP